MFIFTTLLVVATIIFNLIVAYTCTAKEMKTELIDGQCTVGMVCANTFYSLAWVLKGLKFIICKTIR